MACSADLIVWMNGQRKRPDFFGDAIAGGETWAGRSVALRGRVLAALLVELTLVLMRRAGRLYPRDGGVGGTRKASSRVVLLGRKEPKLRVHRFIRNGALMRKTRIGVEQVWLIE